MKVKCIKTAISKPDKHTSNNDVGEFLKPGMEFWVYGLEFSEDKFYAYIFPDESHLISVPLELFEIIDDRIPDIWKINSKNHDGINFITLWPKLFYEKDFWENFSDYQEKERQAFEEIRKFMEQRCFMDIFMFIGSGNTYIKVNPLERMYQKATIFGMETG